MRRCRPSSSYYFATNFLVLLFALRYCDFHPVIHQPSDAKHPRQDIIQTTSKNIPCRFTQNLPAADIARDTRLGIDLKATLVCFFPKLRFIGLSAMKRTGGVLRGFVAACCGWWMSDMKTEKHVYG